MEKPHIAAKEPIAVELEAGRTYHWCACGRSATQPFCNGAHRDTPFTPKAFTAEKSETRYLCACKQTKTAPFCDGTHRTL